MKRLWPLWIVLSRAVLAAVFVGAAIAKINDPAAFALSVFRYRLLPSAAVNAVALFLPFVELLCGALLVAGRGRMRAAAALLVSGMLLVFTAAIALNLLRGIDIACGCFTTDPAAGTAGGWNILRNLALLLPAVSVLLDSLRSPSP